MCELMTIAAALVFTALYFAAKKRGWAGRSSLFTTMLMFWGAALMWAVDCAANAMEGEALLDISREDTILGLIVVGAGLCVFAALFIAEKFRCAKKKPSSMC